MAYFFLYHAIQLAVRVEPAQARNMETRNFAFCKVFFSSHCASGAVSTSSAKIFVQETCAEYQTLAASQEEYHPQDSQRTESFQVQERAIDLCPVDGSHNHQGNASKSKDEASQWEHLQHVHLLTQRNTLHTSLLFYISSSKRDLTYSVGSWTRLLKSWLEHLRIS
jgi:hypothetical protein